MVSAHRVVYWLMRARIPFGRLMWPVYPHTKTLFAQVYKEASQTAQLLQGAITLALQARLKSQAGIQVQPTACLAEVPSAVPPRTDAPQPQVLEVDVVSSAGELLGGRFGGMSVAGQDWCTPLQLSARTIEASGAGVSVGELQVDPSSLLFQQRVALRNIPRGHCTLLLSASDLANFMTHQLMHQAAGRAVQGQAFLFDRNSVRFSAPAPGGPHTTTGRAATTQAVPTAAGTGQQAVAPVSTLSSSNTSTHQLGGGKQGWVHYSGSFSGQQYHVSMQVGCDPLTASHRGPPWQGASPLPSPRYGAARPAFSSAGPAGRAPLPPPQRVVVLARRSRPGHTQQQQQQQQQQQPGAGGAGQAPTGGGGRRGWPSTPPARQPAYAAGVPVAAVGVTPAAPTAPAGKAAMASVASAGAGGDPVGAWSPAGDGVDEVVSQGLSQFFTGLRLNMQGVELSSPRMRLLLPPSPARQPPGLGQGPGDGALLEISMDLRLLELPPLNMSF
ncbi:hypothetical protein QJQ45_012584 [Haematococcus lacustris]|nr:hypothetical protein QJQ45_012584 [Haematococcus lacustris]